MKDKLRFFRKLNPRVLGSVFRTFVANLWQMITFIGLLFLYLTAKSLSRMASFSFFPGKLTAKLQPKLFRFYQQAVKVLGSNREGSISRIDLIEISFRNMKAKKTRTMITIGGMAIGIGAIVFLVSIGYGLQHLVVSRVARLEEMRQADVSPQPGGKMKINDKTLADFKQISNVQMVLPLITVVGRINYQNSVTDMPVYGVTTDYLKQSAIRPIKGRIFESDALTVSAASAAVEMRSGQVAGVGTEAGAAKYGEEIQEVEFTINPGAWLRVREKPTTNSAILGYTKRTEGKQSGVEFWGGSYQSEDGRGEIGRDEEGNLLGKWVKASVPLWRGRICSEKEDKDCFDGQFMVMRDEDDQQARKTAYFAEINLSLSLSSVIGPQVLGVKAASEIATDSAEIGWVEIATEAGIIETPEVKIVEPSDSAIKQAVANQAMLKVLGIKESEALNKTFSVVFTVVGDLLESGEKRIESTPIEYTIIGIIPEEKTPIFYVPFIDLRSLGLVNYSQVKVVVKDQAGLEKVRQQIEAMGFGTRSVADTVIQVNNLFRTARIFLTLLGMVALAVAALGMFNTLTVSLLERTREVGLMKALGMKSFEVKELFLTESMIMGFFGGILGLILGFAAGKLLGIVLSLFAVFKGVGLIDVSSLPFPFILLIIVLSLVVGAATGFYPARRATKISALDALRYE